MLLVYDRLFSIVLEAEDTADRFEKYWCQNDVDGGLVAVDLSGRRHGLLAAKKAVSTKDIIKVFIYLSKLASERVF